MTTAELRALEVDGLSVSLSGRSVLRDVTFAVEAGAFTGLIGTNGAGKTTLLRAIIGMHPHRAGTVRVLGHPLSSQPRSVGYVPQKLLLDPEAPLRARDLIGLGLDGHKLGLPLRNRRRDAAVEETLVAVGAEGFADARVGALSGGEQQRVLIGHAVIGRPALLLLDEPLANLDLHSSQEIVALLGRIARDQQVGVLLSAHEINPLLPVMDHVVYLANGRSVAGRTDEVIRTEVLSALYGHHVDVIDVHGRILVVAGHAGLDDLTLPHEELGPDHAL